MSRRICPSCLRHMHLDENEHIAIHFLCVQGQMTACPGGGQLPLPPEEQRRSAHDFLVDLREAA